MIHCCQLVPFSICLYQAVNKHIRTQYAYITVKSDELHDAMMQINEYGIDGYTLRVEIANSKRHSVGSHWIIM